MDIRHFRHFLAVAEELHFGRAAARLNMAQAPLSQSIRRLEAHLGTRLFDRSPHAGTRLTEAGRSFRPAAERAVQQFDAAVGQARKAGGAASAPVRVGFVTLGLLERLPRALRALENAHPDVSVRLEEGATSALLEGVARGRLDLALVHPAREVPDGVQLSEIRRDRIVAALPRGHPLADRRRVALSELAGDPMIFFPRSASPDLHDSLHAVFRSAGLTPRVHQEARSTPTMLLLVAAGLGHALVAESARFLPFSDVAFVAISDLPADLRWGLDLAWKPELAEAPVRRLAERLLG